MKSSRQEKEFEIQRNMQAASILFSSLCPKEFDMVDGMDSAKQIWDTLQVNHKCSMNVCEGKILALERELNWFIIPENETPQEMFNQLNKIMNKIRALSGDKWSDKDVVDKILTTYIARDVNLPTLIREKRGSKIFTLADFIGKMEQHLNTMKEVKISQELSRIHKQMEKNDVIALKLNLKQKARLRAHHQRRRRVIVIMIVIMTWSYLSSNGRKL
jgi:hypothetical protein